MKIILFQIKGNIILYFFYKDIKIDDFNKIECVIR